jgi:DNA-binding beta-propeller fold protein YncE
MTTKQLPAMIEKLAFGVLVALSLLAAGCMPQPPRYRAALEGAGEIHLYLQPMSQEVHRVNFSLSAISAVRDDGDVIQIPLSRTELIGQEIMGAQKRLASAPLPPGVYKGLSITIEKASVHAKELTSDLLVPEEALWIGREFTIARRRAHTLFLSLDAKRLVSEGYRFTPEFSLAEPRRQLRTLLGYATNSEENLISVFNKHTMEVVDTIATSSGPKGAVIDERRGWVYVALAGDDAIEAIEVNTGEILQKLQLNFGDEPVEIALSPDREFLVSANYGSNSASIIDTLSLREIGRVSLPSEPTDVVTSPVSRRAYLLQPLSNSVSAIDLQRLEISATRTLDETPTRGAVSGDGDRLYVITRFSSDLLVLNASNLSLMERIYVGTGAISIQVDSGSGLIYVGMKSGGISIIDPRLLMPIDRFRTNRNAANMAVDDDENSLFVVFPGQETIQKLDLVSKRLKGVIEVPKGSYDVVLMGSR